MRDFAERYRSLDETNKTLRKVAAMRDYFAQLYNDETVSTQLRNLMEEKSTARAKHLRRIKAKTIDLDYAYSVMRWCDRCSLTLAQCQLPAMERRLEIAPLGDERYDILQRKDQSLSVDPWPFDSSEFEVGAELYTLEKLEFRDDEQLWEFLKECAPAYRSWTFRKSD